MPEEPALHDAWHKKDAWRTTCLICVQVEPQRVSRLSISVASGAQGQLLPFCLVGSPVKLCAQAEQPEGVKAVDQHRP